MFSVPPWGRTSCSTIFWPLLGNCNSRMCLISLFVYYTVSLFSNLFFFFHGGTPCNNLPYPGELGPVEALTVRLIAGSLSIALGESAVSNRKRTHKSRQTQLEHELNKTNRQLAEYGDYCSVTNGRKKNFPRYFTDYLEFFAVFQNYCLFNPAFYGGDPNGFVQNPGWETQVYSLALPDQFLSYELVISNGILWDRHAVC